MKFIPVSKKCHYVHVGRPESGTAVHDIIEDRHYTTDESRPFVIIGTRGELRAVSLEELTNDYQISKEEAAELKHYPKVVFTREGNPVRYWAAIVLVTERQFAIRTAAGTIHHGNRDGVEHGWGDVIVAADDGGKPSAVDRWVVNGLVFFDTYQILEE